MHLLNQIQKNNTTFFHSLAGIGFLSAYITVSLHLGNKGVLLSLLLLSAGFGGVSQEQRSGFHLLKLYVFPLVLCLLGSTCMTLFNQTDQSFAQFALILKDNCLSTWNGEGIVWFLIAGFAYLLVSSLPEKPKWIVSLAGCVIGAFCLFKGVSLPFHLACVLLMMPAVCLTSAVRTKVKWFLLGLSRIGGHFPLYVVSYAWSWIFANAVNVSGNAYITLVLRLVMVLFGGEVLAYMWHVFIERNEEDEVLYEKVRSFINRHRNIYDLIFYILFGLVFFYHFYRTTTFEQVMIDHGYDRKITLLAEFAVLLLLLYAFITMIMEKSRKRIGFMFLILLTEQIIWNTSWILEVATMSIAVVAAGGKSAKTLLREIIIIGVSFMIAAMVCAKTGKIINVVIGETKESLGIIYYTDCMAHWSYLYMLSFIAWPRRMTWYRAGLYTGLILLIYRFTHARTSLVCMILFTMIAFVIDLIDKDHQKLFRHTKLLKISYSAFFIGALISYALVFTFGPDRILVDSIFYSMHVRQNLAYLAFQTYPVHLFGNVISEIGFGGGMPDPINPYFFIDCSYVRLLLMYGVIFFGIMMTWMTGLIHRALKYKNLALLLMLIVVAIQCIPEHHMHELFYNSLPLLFFMKNDLPVYQESVNKKYDKLPT